MLRQLKYSNGIDEIEIGQGQKSPFLLVNVEGLGYKTNIFTNKSVYQNGESFIDSNLQMRNIEIELAIKDNYILNRNRLYDIFRANTEGTFTYIQGDIKRKVNCYVESLDTTEKSEVQTVLISLIAPNPFFYDLENTLLAMASWDKSFYFPVPYGIDTVIFGLRNNQQVKNIYNYGNAKTPIKIIFENSSSKTIINPRLTKIYTKDFIQINDTLSMGDKITIDTQTKRIEKNGVNIFNKRQRGSKFFMLEPGDNFFRFDADSNTEFLNVTIEYNSAYLGV